MGIFNRSKPKKRSARRTSAKILSSMGERRLIGEAGKNRDLLLNFALKEKGLEDIAKALEEAKKPKSIFNAKVSELALKRLDDPAYAEQFVEDFVRSAFGHEGKPVTGEEVGYLQGRDGEGSAARQLIDQMEDIDELKQRLGGGGSGGLSGMITPEVVAGVIDLVKTLITKGQPQGPQLGRTYIIDIEGQPREVSEQDYKRLVESGQIKSVGMLSAPAPQPVTVPPEVKVTNLPTESKIADPPMLAMIQDYINMPPGAFVNRITGEASAGIPYAIFLTRYLPTTNYDDLVKIIAPYKSSEKLGKYVEWVAGEAGKIWVERVLEAARKPSLAIV